MEEEPCRGGAASRQVTRGGGAPGLPRAEPRVPWLGAGDTAAWVSHPPAQLGRLAIAGVMGAGWLL